MNNRLDIERVIILLGVFISGMVSLVLGGVESTMRLACESGMLSSLSDGDDELKILTCDMVSRFVSKI